MSELLASFGAPPEVEQELGEVVETVPRTPVLITEQQVLFATAAALPLQPTTGRPKPRHYPPRHDYLEDSRMAREMLRL